MITLNELIAEIETTFQNLTETGEIDRLSIKNWVIGCLRQLGKNICDQREGFIEIKNSQGNLPETFKSLILALKLEPEGCQILGDRRLAEKSYVYKQRIEQPAYFDWVTNEYVTNCKTKIITEKVIMDTEAAEFYYTPEMLSVVKGFKKDSFDADCININPSLRQAYPNQININGRTVQTNFRENCRLYIQYNSLPIQNGEIAIPSISTEDIYKWITNTIKIRIVENLIINNKNPTPGLQSMLQLWLQQDRQLFLAAKSESNWSGMGNWQKGYKRKLQIEMDAYNLPRH